MESYDVVIIGAGPAGLKCAHTLSESDKSVLLLEKNGEIGPKVCAGGILNHDIEALKLPKDIIGRSFKRMILHTPHNKDVIDMEEPFVYTLEREDLGQWQLSLLKKTDAVVKTNAAVTKIDKGHVELQDGSRFSFKHLVGADGSSSIVRRHLGIDTKELDIAIQYLIEDKDFPDIEVHMDSGLFHSWYAWIFPHKDYVSIGTGCDPHYIPLKKIRENFSTWLKRMDIDVSDVKFQSHPINFDYQGHQFGNIFLAGDAAGFASGITGEGIYQALVSGEEVAKTILDPKYESERIERLLAIKKFHNWMLHLFERSGSVRKLEHEILALLLKSKFMDRKMIKLLS